ncbi:unnamed protein product [Tilletia controversa]|nr:unnamed protein product [Tilletia controversa]
MRLRPYPRQVSSRDPARTVLDRQEPGQRTEMSSSRDLADPNAVGGSAQNPSRSGIPVSVQVRAGRGSDTRAAEAPLDPDALNSSPGSFRPRLDAEIDAGIEKQGPPREDLADAEYDEYGDEEYDHRQSEIDASYVSGLVKVAVQESQNDLVKLLTQMQGELKGLRQEVARVREVPSRSQHGTARASLGRPEATPRTGRFSRVPYAQTVSFMPRPSTDPASNLMLGSEAATRPPTRPPSPSARIPPHLLPEFKIGTTTNADATNDAEDGRSFRSGGSYGRVAQFMEFSGHTEDEVMAAMPGCFSGPAKTWFSNLTPPPRSLVELRVKVFKAYSRPESQISELLDEKKFDPSSGSLADYLDDKYSLVTELHTARAINRGTLGTDPRCLDAVMTTATVRDAIDQTHRGLPAYWQSVMEGCSKTAEDWTDYRSSILANERRTRMGIAELVAMMGPGASSSTPARQRTAVVDPPATMDRARYQPPAPYPAAPHRQPDAIPTRDRKQGLCFHCKLPGHLKRDCPKLKDAVRVVRNTLVTLESGTDEQRDAAIQEILSRAAPPEKGGDHTPGDNETVRVRNARAVRVSGYESSDCDQDEGRTRCVRGVNASATSSRPPPVGPGKRHRSVVAHKAAVYVSDARDRYELHVDGGSPLSMITPHVLHSIAPFAQVHPPEPLKVRGYRGNDYQRTSGVVVLPVSFTTANNSPPVNCRFEFHVVEDCTGGWILGVDNMKADGIDARSKKERLEFEKRPDAEVKLLQAKDEASFTPHLLCAEDITVQARTTCLVQVQAVEEDLVVKPWLFVGEEQESGGAQVPWCVVGPETRVVEFRNEGDTPLVLRTDDPLGTLVALEREFKSFTRCTRAGTRWTQPDGRRSTIYCGT